MPSTTSTTGEAASPRRRSLDHFRALTSRWLPLRGRPLSVAYFLYYLAILIALLLIYSRGNFTTPTFIYQGF